MKKVKTQTQLIRMSGWGDLYLLPHLDLNLNYGRITLMLAWWVFRVDILFYKPLPEWALHLWDIITLHNGKHRK